MLDGIKITFVAVVDNRNKYKENLTHRIWHHEKLVKKLLAKSSCLIGRKTFELTRWKGEKSWVLTRNLDWRCGGIGTIHNIDDIHLHIETDELFVIGGQSLFEQFQDYVDEINLYVFNNNKGDNEWIRFDMKDWRPVDYFSNKIWSYAKLEKLIQINE